jgi:hypothetical protein
MADEFKEEFDRLLNHPLQSADKEHFLRRMDQRIRRTQRSRIARAVILALALALVAGAALFVTLSFLQMAGSEVVYDNPTAAVAFWFPYGVVAVTLALFLRALIEQAFRHFVK